MKKRAAVIGYGGMGAGFHCQHISNSDVCELAGIYDIDPAKRALAASRGVKVYDSREALLADPTIDMVTVATPNDVHEEIAVAALKAGKHVISEKPVTLSMESLERMIAAANAAGRIFSVHQNRRFDVDALAMKQLHDSGEIGEVIDLESRIHGSRGIPSDWRGMKEYGGGMLYDWGVHIIDQACMILGYDVKSVRCSFDHITNQEVDDGFRLWIEYASGQKAYLEVGTYNFIAMPRFYMRATKGSAIITDWRVPAHMVKCKAWHESDVLPVVNASGLTKTMAPRDSVTVDEYDLPRPVSDVHDYYRNFVRAMDGLEEQMVTHDQMRCVLRIILSAFRSAETGEAVVW
ncbi:MAG: Gfo/Idh/MocA family oxidoreductase [Oscillospiraceae bacterium]|nr:Gfo/Idh/MocA family oxidoreductase [Oscillospiraceae bacterium]